MSNTTLALLGEPGIVQLLILGFIGLLIFGKRLPEVGKNLGKSITEFKKGLNSKPTEDNEEGAEEVAPVKPAKPALKSAHRPSKQLISSSDEP